jgi:hypothetical protein
MMLFTKASINGSSTAVGFIFPVASADSGSGRGGIEAEDEGEANGWETALNEVNGLIGEVEEKADVAAVCVWIERMQDKVIRDVDDTLIADAELRTS